MALAADVTSVIGIQHPAGMPIITPAGGMFDWIDVLLAGAGAVNGVDASDNAGGEVLLPGAITRPKLALFSMLGRGTSVQVRLKHDLTGGKTLTTEPVVQLFGLDSAGVPERLYDGSSPKVHALTMTHTTGTDVQWSDGTTTWSFTDSQEVDCNSATKILVAIKTAAAGTCAATATIQLRIK